MQPREVTLGGHRFRFPGANPEIRQRIYMGCYESAERRLLPRILRPDDRVLDIGAGLGLVGLSIARITPALRMYEANPALIPAIRENFALNGKEADIVEAAIVPDSHEGETVSFGVNEALWSSSLCQREGEAARIEAPTVRISDAVADYRPSVIVMDVEGAECDILTGALPGVRAVLVEMHARVTGFSPQRAMMQRMFQAGFAIDLTRSEREIVTFIQTE